MTLDPIVRTPSRLSWSSVSTYSECGQKWLLERGFHVPSSTWFATLAGSAIHTITEARDRLELMGFTPREQIEFSPAFKAEFDREIAASEAPEIKPSGRKLTKVGETGGPSKKDYDWWLQWGPIFLERWMNFKSDFGWEILTLPDGQPGIELKFEIELGGYPVLGFIDRAYVGPAGITLLDLKTGSMPSGSLQLKTYDLGLKQAYGIEADWGVFWTPTGGDAGKLSNPADLRKWSDARMEGMYAAAMRGISAGVFQPHISSMCTGCSVRQHCWAVAGDLADELPEQPSVLNRTTGELSFDPYA